MTARQQDPLGVVGTIVACVVALLIGAFVGVMGSVAHRQWQGLLTLHWGLVAALVLAAAALVGLRLVFESRLVAAAGALGVLAATGLLALPSSGGTVLVDGDWQGWSWLVGQVVVALGAILWPGPSSRPETGTAPTRLDL